VPIHTTRTIRRRPAEVIVTSSRSSPLASTTGPRSSTSRPRRASLPIPPSFSLVCPARCANSLSILRHGQGAARERVTHAVARRWISARGPLRFCAVEQFDRPRVTRRALLGAAAAGLALGGCSREEPPAPRPPDPQTVLLRSLIEDKTRLIALYRQTAAAHTGLAPALEPF